MLTKADIVDIIFAAVNGQAGGPGNGAAAPLFGQGKNNIRASQKTGGVTAAGKAVNKNKILLDDDSGGSAKVFLSDWQLRKQYAKGTKIIEVPANSIISPLAQDWIDFEGIKVVFK